MNFLVDQRMPCNPKTLIQIQSSQKLQKVLAAEGFASRREIEKWIQLGRIAVNGEIALLGRRVDVKDKITLDGRLLSIPHVYSPHKKNRILLYYKPEYEICSTRDPQGRRTVFDKLPDIKPLRWITVGRLDYNTSGLLLFTTDGLLSHRLLHPSYEIEREYAVRVYGRVTPTVLDRLQQGVLLDGELARFSKIIVKPSGKGNNHWYHVILKEGKQREVRRLWATQGVTVSRLIRVRFGPVVLPTTMRPGSSTYLSEEAIQQLKREVRL